MKNDFAEIEVGLSKIGHHGYSVIMDIRRLPT